MEPRWLWPFELIEKIGEGGMGVVYRARYSGNDRMVAVKLLPQEVAADAVLLARFERELDVLKQLHHPNIVRCFGGTCESSQRFYAMELVDGGTLGELLERKGHLTWEFVVDYALQMCEALQYAHQNGVIHRDVKPGNFLLTKSGQIKLSDFGLASIATTNRLTAAGRTVGTIQYMAPEQIRGKTLTGRADLYALGCVLYEMLTGFPPYSGENAATVMQQHLTGPIPHAAASVLDCPLKLDQLICELLSKDADQRPATAAEVGWRLEEILQPGRRVQAVEPEFFSGSLTKTKVSPLQNIAATPSEASLPTAGVFGGSSLLPWGLVVVMLLACGLILMKARTTAERLKHAEEQWAQLLQRPEPGLSAAAAQSLIDFGPLQSSTIQTLRDATKNPKPEIRKAALSVMAKHASECRHLQVEVLHLEKVDENPDVRYQANVTVAAMKDAPAGSTFWNLVYWFFIVAVVTGLGLLGWRVWHRAKPIA